MRLPLWPAFFCCCQSLNLSNYGVILWICFVVLLVLLLSNRFEKGNESLNFVGAPVHDRDLNFGLQLF
jgi:hypothetical protein